MDTTSNLLSVHFYIHRVYAKTKKKKKERSKKVRNIKKKIDKILIRKWNKSWYDIADDVDEAEREIDVLDTAGGWN